MADKDDVRLIIADTDSDYFTDAQIESFLRLEGDDVRRASALALETMASNEALVQKQIRILDLSTNGPAVAKELRERAAVLREQADDEDGGFDIYAWSDND